MSGGAFLFAESVPFNVTVAGLKRHMKTVGPNMA